MNILLPGLEDEDNEQENGNQPGQGVGEEADSFFFLVADVQENWFAYYQPAGDGSGDDKQGQHDNRRPQCLYLLMLKKHGTLVDNQDKQPDIPDHAQGVGQWSENVFVFHMHILLQNNPGNNSMTLAIMS